MTTRLHFYLIQVTNTGKVLPVYIERTWPFSRESWTYHKWPSRMFSMTCIVHRSLARERPTLHFKAPLFRPKCLQLSGPKHCCVNERRALAQRTRQPSGHNALMHLGNNSFNAILRSRQKEL